MIGWRGASNPGPIHFNVKNAEYGKRKATQMYDSDMPVSLWCEFGGWENGHPFSSKDPEYQVMQQTRKVDVPTGNSYGRPTYQERTEVTETIVICGQHIQEMSRSFRKSAPEIGPTLETLEEEDTSYRAGYDAAMERVLNRPMTEDEKEKLHP